MVIGTVKGFSLIEAIVTGALVSIIAIVLITFLNFTHMQVNDGLLRAKIQTDYDGVATFLGNQIRMGSLVLGPDETPDTLKTDIDVQEIHIFLKKNETYQDTSAYRISDNKLQEKGSSGWKNLSTGHDSVNLTSKSKFILMPGRKSVILDFELRQRYKTKTDTLQIKRSIFLCRN